MITQIQSCKMTKLFMESIKLQLGKNNFFAFNYDFWFHLSTEKKKIVSRIFYF